MFNIIKTDFKRVVKDKLFLVLCIIGGVFAFITPILYKAVFSLLEIDTSMMQDFEALGISATAKSMFFGSFSLSNNVGFVLPIFVSIILYKDFSHGTIRNKIICGKSRFEVYFSLLVNCIVLTCGVIMASALLTLAISLLFFDYQVAEFTLNDFGYLMASIGLELLVYIFICALLSFLLVSTKNVGLTIVLYFAIAFLLIIVGTVTQLSFAFVDPSKVSYKILEFLNVANVFTTTTIGTGTSYELKEILYLVVPSVLLTAGLVVLGFVTFKKKELK